jgi:hypothetical protein
MASSDYCLCDLCGGKAFYDANITDTHYVATYDRSEKADPIGLAVLCSDCNKTHEAIIRPRTEGHQP